MTSKHPWVAQMRVPSPIGELALVATAKGIAGIWFDDQAHHPGTLEASTDAAHPHLQATARWLDDYWRHGPSRMRAPMPALDPQGTPFQQAVWRALLTIAAGRTSTYGAIAAQAGAPSGARAAGAAIGRNPLGILVPCHRVIGKDGSLTGYAGGLDRKIALLKHEASTLQGFALEACPS